MTSLAGIATKKNTKGQITHITFNVKKHKKTIEPILHQIEAVKKSKFMQEFEKGISVEECFDQVRKHIREKWTN